MSLASRSDNPAGIDFSRPTKSGRLSAERLSWTSASLETPMNGEASTVTSASSS